MKQEQATVRRSIDRYFAALEEGSMSPTTCQKRIEGLESQLDALIAEGHTLETHEQASAPPSPEIVAEWAKNLDVILRSGSAQQRKALIRKLIKELRVISRDEILPTYRIPALVRAPGHQVDLRGVEPLTSPVRECGRRIRPFTGMHLDDRLRRSRGIFLVMSTPIHFRVLPYVMLGVCWVQTEQGGFPLTQLQSA
jgi:hypothetical protein